MKTITPSIQIFSSVCLIAMLQGISSASPADNRVQFGIDSLKSGDYLSAKKWLETARSKGASHPDLYNALGLSYYHLGENGKARDYFLQAINTPRKHEAAYFLGKTAERNSDTSSAKRWFSQAAEQYEDLEIQRAADQALLTLKLENSSATRAEKHQQKSSFAFLATEASMTNGIINPDDSSGNNDEDSSVSLLAAGSTTLTPPNATISWKLGGSAYLEKYSDFSDYDITSIATFTSAGKRIGKHDLTGKVGFSHITLDADPYLQQTELSLKDTVKLAQGKSLRLKARYIDVNNPEEQYAYYAGEITEVGAELRGGKDLAWRVGLTLRNESREDLDTSVSNTAGDSFNGFTSYSRNLAQIKGRLSWQWAENWKQQVEMSYRHASYESPDQFLNDSSDTALTSLSRETDRVKIKAQLTRPISKNMDIHLAVEHLEDDSNNNQYDFKSQTLSTGLSYMF